MCERKPSYVERMSARGIINAEICTVYVWLYTLYSVHNTNITTLEEEKPTYGESVDWLTVAEPNMTKNFIQMHTIVFPSNSSTFRCILFFTENLHSNQSHRISVLFMLIFRQIVWRLVKRSWTLHTVIHRY